MLRDSHLLGSLPLRTRCKHPDQPKEDGHPARVPKPILAPLRSRRLGSVGLCILQRHV